MSDVSDKAITTRLTLDETSSLASTSTKSLRAAHKHRSKSVGKCNNRKLKPEPEDDSTVEEKHVSQIRSYQKSTASQVLTNIIFWVLFAFVCYVTYTLAVNNVIRGRNLSKRATEEDDLYYIRQKKRIFQQRPT